MGGEDDAPAGGLGGEGAGLEMGGEKPVFGEEEEEDFGGGQG